MATRFHTLSPAQSHVWRFWPADERAHMVGSRFFAVDRTCHDVLAALAELIARHEALRSRIVVLGSTVLQAVDPAATSTIRVERLADGETVDVASARCGAEATVLDPADGAARFVVFAAGDRACGVLGIVHHLFVDRFGLDALQADLVAVLSGVPAQRLSRCSQPSGFASAAHAAEIVANNEFWQRQLGPAARSCTAAVGRREPWEKRAHVRIVVPADLHRGLTAVASRLRTGPAVVWSAALSLLFRAWAGASRQVFEATLTNRRSPADFAAVAEIDQVVYVPVDLTGTDHVDEVVASVRHAYLAAYDRSNYRSDMVTRWLERDENFRGAIFRPTFGVNYLARSSDTGPAAPPPADAVSVELHDDRYLPYRYASDVSAVVHADDGRTQVLLQVAEPLWQAREPHAIADDLLTVVRQLAAPGPAGAPGVAPLPDVSTLLTGHRSAVGVDLRAVTDLIGAHPAVRQVRVTPEYDDHDLLVRAEVRLDERLPVAELAAHARERQPWFLGSVVPDLWTVVDAGN